MTPTSAQACNEDPQTTLALSKSALSSGAEAVTPLGQPVCGNAEIPENCLQALYRREAARRRLPYATSTRLCGLFGTCCFLSANKSSTPCQEIGSQVIVRMGVASLTFLL